MDEVDAHNHSNIDPAAFKDAFYSFLVPPLPRGVLNEGPDCRFPSEAGVWAGSRGFLGRKHSWVDDGDDDGDDGSTAAIRLRRRW